MYIDTGRSVQFIQCTFISCSAYNGGGVYIQTVSIQSIHCTFTSCSATSEGGGIRLSSEHELNMNGLSFNNCSAEAGGAFYIYLSV